MKSNSVQFWGGGDTRYSYSNVTHSDSGGNQIKHNFTWRTSGIATADQDNIVTKISMTK
jgi:hypothetical protein